MALRKALKGLRSSTGDLHRERLTDRFVCDELGTIAIADAPFRTRIAIAGEVARMRVVPRSGSPSLEVTVDDGTGRALVVFTGRRRIGGIEPGRSLVGEGTAREEHGKAVLMNPAYRLLPS